MSNNPTHVELKRRVKELEEEAVKGIRAQEALRKTLAKLERKAKERTSELVRRNEDLKREAEERKQVEEALRESKERYSLATRAARVGVWDWNVQTGEFYLDPNVKAILGYSDDEIPNDLDVWATYVYPDDRQPVMEAFQAHLERQTPEFIYEHRMLHKDGSIRWILARGTALRDAQGNPIRVVGTVPTSPCASTLNKKGKNLKPNSKSPKKWRPLAP